MKKTIIISLLLLIIPFINVSAKNVDEYTSAYGYYYYDSNNTKHTVNWTGYSSSNNVSYGYDLPAEYIFIVDYGIRFRINGGFKAGTNYAITFSWYNYSPDVNLTGDWYYNYSNMWKQFSCRESSWSSTSLSDSTCFESNRHTEKSVGSNPDSEVIVTFYFTPKIDIYGINIYWQHDNNGYYESAGWEIYNVTYTENTDSSQAIIDNASQNTQNIINNQNTNTSSIINNQNTNTQNIINNQNQNTQAIIDSNKTCELIDVSSIKKDNFYLNALGVEISSSAYGITDFYNIVNRDLSIAEPIGSTSAYYCFYSSNKTLVSCSLSSSAITIPSNASFFKASIHKQQNKPVFKLCQNGSQAVVDSLTDETPPDTSSLGNSAGWLPPGPVDSILNLPLALLNNLSISLSGTCQAVNVPIPYLENQTITIPCLTTIYSQLTDFASFWNWVGWLVSGIILYKYFLHLYKWVDDTLTFRENNWIDNWGGV